MKRNIETIVKRTPKSRRRSRLASCVEAMEDRCLFSVYTVTTLGDGAGTITPAGSGKFNSSTLRAAINAANSHTGSDTVNFASGLVGKISPQTALPHLRDTVSIVGPGVSRISLDGGQLYSYEHPSSSLLHIDSDVTASVSGLTLANSDGETVPEITWIHSIGGGAIYNEGRLTVNDCRISGNGEFFSPRITGAGIFNTGSLTVRNTTFADNAAYVIYDHSSAGDGGAISNWKTGTVTCVDCRFTGNTGGEDGGAISNAGVLYLIRCTFDQNSCNYGSGGAIISSGNLSAVDCHFLNSRSYQYSGGAIAFYGAALTLTGYTITCGRSSETGGGIVIGAGSARIDRCVISANSAGFSGGGIDNAGSLTLTRSTVSGNQISIDLPSVGGGGIYNRSGGMLVVSDSTIDDNVLVGDMTYATSVKGGGLLNQGTARIVNSTIAGNRVNPNQYNAQFGGGVANSGTLGLTNCTIAGNIGGGIHSDGGSLSLSNTIVSGNKIDVAAVDVVASPKATGFNNIIGVGGSGGLVNGKNGNRVGVTAAQLKLGPLADNGGPTQTMALLPGSIAINTGSNAKAIDSDGKPLTTDQRGVGFARMVGGTVDVGAFESQLPVPATGSISGIVFKDLNGSRFQDAGEVGLKGWLVWADLNRDGKLNYNEPRTSSNSKGQYVLIGVPAGFQYLRLEKRAGWQQTTPRGGGPHGPTVYSGLETKHWDFGVRPILG